MTPHIDRTHFLSGWNIFDYDLNALKFFISTLLTYARCCFENNEKSELLSESHLPTDAVSRLEAPRKINELVKMEGKRRNKSTKQKEMQ